MAYLVELSLFNANDMKFRTWTSGNSEQRPIVSRSQINAMVTSIVPLVQAY